MESNYELLGAFIAGMFIGGLITLSFVFFKDLIRDHYLPIPERITECPQKQVVAPLSKLKRIMKDREGTLPESIK